MTQHPLPCSRQGWRSSCDGQWLVLPRCLRATNDQKNRRSRKIAHRCRIMALAVEGWVPLIRRRTLSSSWAPRVASAPRRGRLARMTTRPDRTPYACSLCILGALAAVNCKHRRLSRYRPQAQRCPRQRSPKVRHAGAGHAPHHVVTEEARPRRAFPTMPLTRTCLRPACAAQEHGARQRHLRRHRACGMPGRSRFPAHCAGGADCSASPSQLTCGSRRRDRHMMRLFAPTSEPVDASRRRCHEFGSTAHVSERLP